MVAYEIKGIIEQSGLKKYHIAQECRIPVQRFSSYINNKGTLTINQLHRLHKYLEELENKI